LQGRFEQAAEETSPDIAVEHNPWRVEALKLRRAAKE
jgi:hypothetical protein